MVKSGDTVESISSSTLGDNKYWKAIAEFNGLAYPYITDVVPQPDKTLGPGQTIAIPNSLLTVASGNLILGSVSPSVQTPDFALGTDFALDTNGDVIISNGDIQTVSGTENIQQAMFLKLNVHRGELPAHPHYGMADLRGYRAVNLLSAKAAAEFHDTVLSDSRVSELKNASVSISGDTLNYSAEVSVKLTNQPIALHGSVNIAS
jgi:LysM repeat protein